MLNKMQQSGQANMQQVFNRIMQKSIQKSGAQIDPQDIPNSLGGIIANSMVATIEEAKRNRKQVPPQIVLQSAIDISKEALAKLQLPDEQLDQLMAQVFAVAMEMFLAMSQKIITPEERAKYEQFMQMVSQNMQQGAAPEQQPQGDM